jgi:hypothetical protein
MTSKAFVFKFGKDWYAVHRGESVTCPDWGMAMQAAWGLVMFPSDAL